MRREHWLLPSFTAFTQVLATCTAQDKGEKPKKKKAFGRRYQRNAKQRRKRGDEDGRQQL